MIDIPSRVRFHQGRVTSNMIEWIALAIFLAVSSGCWRFAPDLIWPVPAGDPSAQVVDAIQFSALLAAAVTLAKVAVMYVRHRSEYASLAEDLRGARQSFRNLTWMLLKRLAASLFFAAIIVVAELREPMRTADSWFNFALLSAVVYMGVGAVLDLMKFLPLFARRWWSFRA